MKKLYLVRKKLFEFIGPIDGQELNDAYHKMKFGIDDEVCGNCGEWVSLSDRGKLKSLYPEIAKIVNSDLENTWGVSAEETIVAKTKTSTPSRFFLRLLFVIGLMALGGFTYLYFTSPQVIRPWLVMLKLANESYIDRLKLLYNDNQNPEAFSYFFRQNQAEIINQYRQNKSRELIPYIRAYAFKYSNGKVEGVRAKELLASQGTRNYSDCSLKAWGRRWKANSQTLQTILNSEVPPSFSKLQVLSWDPNWIKRRPEAGWIYPSSGYHACILTAKSALEMLFDDVGFLSSLGATQKEIEDNANTTLLRLMVQIQIIESDNWTITETKGKNSLDFLNCIETATDFSRISQCVDGSKKISKSKLLEPRVGWNLLRIALEQIKMADSNVFATLDSWEKQLKEKTLDTYTGISYAAEHRMLQLIVKKRGTPPEVYNRVRVEYPGVSFKLPPNLSSGR